MTKPLAEQMDGGPRPASWLGTTNDVTRRPLAAGRIPGLVNMAGGLPASETYPAEELAALTRQVIVHHQAAPIGLTTG